MSHTPAAPSFNLVRSCNAVNDARQENVIEKGCGDSLELTYWGKPEYAQHWSGQLQADTYIQDIKILTL